MLLHDEVEWGVFRAFYESVWQQPVLLITVPLAFFFVLPRRRSFLVAYLWFFSTETIIDAIATSSLMPARGFDLLFVLLGDARVFMLTERYSRAKRGWGWLIGVAGLTVTVPLLQATAIFLLPDWFDNVRHTYLCYECLFVVLLLAYRFWLGRVRVMTKAVNIWLNQVTAYALTYYALWAAADLLILSGIDAGYGVRVVPNLLYYGLFLPFVWSRAPQEIR